MVDLMVVVIGFDIGGANIKAVKISVDGKNIVLENLVREYMPIWIRGVKGLKEKLEEIKNRFKVELGKYFVGVCMTAELSDIFYTKSEGVAKIIEVVEEVFKDAVDRFYVNYDFQLVKAEEAKTKPITIAAANWAASAWFLERILPSHGLANAIFIDIGSTTTTIIPIVKGRVAVRGKTDPEKLLYGELVYVGTLRTDVASLIDRAPYKGFYVGICREKFSLVGDVHLVLRYIKPEDYTTETADGRGKDVENAVARLSRVVCADKDMVSIAEVREIARYIYEVEIFKVFQALIQIRSWLASQNVDLDNFVAVVAGIGKHIASEAARRAGFVKIIDIDELVGYQLAGVIPAYGTALMVLDKLGVVDVNSTQGFRPSL
jgi:probable H4MPT-linked C1 transfer pathway protein